VPLIVSSALFMQNLDSTVLTTALPTIARDFGSDPLHLKLALTSYLMALAVFVPASGWIADRFGARPVFQAALGVFALGSVGCALSWDLASLVAARVLQGLGGAMMLPVARLLVLRSVPRGEMVAAFAMLSMPALVAPIMGPPVGGFLTSFLSWH
jgi:MFS family permease